MRPLLFRALPVLAVLAGSAALGQVRLVDANPKPGLLLGEAPRPPPLTEAELPDAAGDHAGRPLSPAEEAAAANPGVGAPKPRTPEDPGATLLSKRSPAFDWTRMVLSLLAAPVGAVGGALAFGGLGLVIDTALVRTAGPMLAIGALSGALVGSVLAVYTVGNSNGGKGRLSATVFGGFLGLIASAVGAVGLAVISSPGFLGSGNLALPFVQLFVAVDLVALPFLGMVVGYELSHALELEKERPTSAPGLAVAPALFRSQEGTWGPAVAGRF